jgi:hypothetical protein
MSIMSDFLSILDIKMTPKRRTQWEATRERGKLRFIITIGIMSWGWFSWVLFGVINQILEFGFSIPTMDVFLAQYTLISLGVWSAMGIFFGLWMWHIGEKAYLKTM